MQPQDPSQGVNGSFLPTSTTGDGANERTGLLGANPIHVSTDDKPPYQKYPLAFLQTTWQVLKSNYANVLLVFVPLGIIAGLAGWGELTVFLLNFLAIVPLAGLLSFATEELSAKLGETLGGLMNATFGNAVELIVSIVALKENQIRIVQASMLGSILSNILLVLGCCFIASGVRRLESSFDATVASTMSSLMAVASACLIIPATLHAALGNGDREREHELHDRILMLSHGTAVIMLILYLLYLFFQLKTHASLFNDPGKNQAVNNDEDPEAVVQQDEGEEGGRKDGDTLAPIPASIALILVTILVAVCAEFLVDSINAVVEQTNMSRTFIGLILLPIVGNAAEHVTAVVVSWKGKMDLALGVAIGSSMQIALFVTPFLVLLGWAMGRDMTLNFEVFETVVFFLSVLVVNYLIQDGKSNYLEGCMCLGTYIIVALAFYVYPDTAGEAGSSMKGFLQSAASNVTSSAA